MSYGTEDVTDTLVTDESSTRELVAAALTALAAGTIVVGFATLLQFLSLEASLAGLSLATLLGASLTAVGIGTVALGVASYQDLLDTRPDHTAGVLNAVFFGLVWFVVGGLVASQTLGLGLAWPLVAFAAGGGAAALALVAREDIAAVLPSAAFSLLVGVVILLGVIAPGWSWHPEGFSVTITATAAVPVIAIVGGLLGGWTAARIYGGFGPQGRQSGAYLLVGTNAAAMLLFLVMLVAFIVVRGFAPLTEGLQWGLFWRPLTWFSPPFMDDYVVIHGPKLWVYWPFVMEGHGLGIPIDGVLPAIVGTIWLVLGAILFAVPLGVGAAIFLTEYAEQGRFTALVEISTNGLWSTPSIVYGLFGLAFLVPRIGNTSSILSGQLVLGFMLLPLVVITSRESLKSVPDEYRDASAALGVSRWETIKSVVLPAAMPGVITGVILGVGRIAGETAPILLVMTAQPFPTEVPHVIQGSFQFTSSFPFVAVPTLDLVQSSSALPYQLYAVITAGLSENLGFAWGTALVLLLVVMGLYAIGVVSRIYFRRKLTQ